MLVDYGARGDTAMMVSTIAALIVAAAWSYAAREWWQLDKPMGVMTAIVGVIFAAAVFRLFLSLP